MYYKRINFERRDIIGRLLHLGFRYSKTALLPDSLSVRKYCRISGMNVSPDSINLLVKIYQSWENKKVAYRVYAMLLVEKGYSCAQVADVLLFDESTIRKWQYTYEKSGIDELIKNSYTGKSSALTDVQMNQLKEELKRNLYADVQSICRFVEKNFKIKYSRSGMMRIVHQLGFVYKKTKSVPCKANLEDQKKFIAEYKLIRETVEKVYFIDGTHPSYNTISGNRWIEKGKEKAVKSNTGRKRVNINGAYSPDDNEVIFNISEKIDSDDTIKLLKKIERHNKSEESIYVISDNARYYRSKKVRKYLEISRIKMLFLPTYSPNLNLIERLWHCLKKDIIYDTYYELYSDFKDKIIKYLKNKSKKQKRKWGRIMSENFHLFPESFYA